MSFLGWYAKLYRTNLVDAAKRRLLIAHLKQDTVFYMQSARSYAIHQYTKSYTIFAKDMAIYGDLRLLPLWKKTGTAHRQDLCGDHQSPAASHDGHRILRDTAECDPSGKRRRTAASSAARSPHPGRREAVLIIATQHPGSIRGVFSFRREHFLQYACHPDCKLREKEV